MSAESWEHSRFRRARELPRFRTVRRVPRMAVHLKSVWHRVGLRRHYLAASLAGGHHRPRRSLRHALALKPAEVLGFSKRSKRSGGAFGADSPTSSLKTSTEWSVHRRSLSQRESLYNGRRVA